MSIRIGVIGTGYLGRHHARIYASMEGVELVAVSDTQKEKSDELAKSYGCKAYVDYHALLDEVEAVNIVSPTSTHYEIAMECLKAGKHLLVEKPITVTVKEADEIINEAEKRALTLQVGHLERYNPAIVSARELIENPVHFDAVRLSPFVNRATDVDVTLDLMIHDIDIIFGFTGGAKVKIIHAGGLSLITRKIDYSKAWLEFENGITATLASSRIEQERVRRINVYMKDSYVTIDYQNKKVNVFKPYDNEMKVEIVDIIDKEPLKEELIDFVDCIKNKRRPMVSGVEGRNALELAIKITEIIYGRR